MTTQIFTSVDECILFSRDALTHLPNLEKIIEDNDFQKWTLKLNDCSDFEKYLCESTFNLLSTSVISGLATKRKLNNPIINHVNILLEKIDLFLSSFSELITDNSFRNKLKNLEGLFFLSTVSELSLAYFLKNLGYKVTFEKKFTQNLTGKKRDIDLTITDNKGEEFNIEVYMPNKQSNIEGFFSPFQDDNHFKEKINNKLIAKFGLDRTSGLQGKNLLAINKVFFDMMHIKSVLPMFDNSKVYNDLIRLLPLGIDGLLIFEDDFGHENSFRFEKILLAQKIN